MAKRRPDALILDDGELADVREVLDRQGTLYVTEGDEVALLEVPLLITSLVRARQLHEMGHPLPKHSIHLVVAGADDQDLRGALGGASCDFIVRRPVETGVLALITRHASYEGPERRRMLRVAIGSPVQITLDGCENAEDANLVQLSIAGCGLVAPDPLPKVNVRLDFPIELTQPRRLSLEARIVRSREVPTADGLVYETSVVFDEVGLSDRVTLRAMMAGQPIDFRPEGTLPAPASESTPDAPTERRGGPRREFTRRTLGSLERSGWARVLIGRDISEHGMRVEHEPDLGLGDTLHLALYASELDDPILVTATVQRDDGEQGWFLDFGPADQGTRTQLRNLLGDLAGEDGPGDHAIWVVSEILEKA